MEPTLSVVLFNSARWSGKDAVVSEKVLLCTFILNACD